MSFRDCFKGLFACPEILSWAYKKAGCDMDVPMLSGGMVSNRRDYVLGEICGAAGMYECFKYSAQLGLAVMAAFAVRSIYLHRKNERERVAEEKKIRDTIANNMHNSYAETLRERAEDEKHTRELISKRKLVCVDFKTRKTLSLEDLLKRERHRDDMIN